MKAKPSPVTSIGSRTATIGPHRKAASNSIDTPATAPASTDAQPDYQVEDQVGFMIRRAHQRASAIFNRHFAGSGLSPVQFATLVKVRDEGRVSQNLLGRLVNIDPATIMGIIQRLSDRQLIRRLPDPTDRRRTLLSITSTGLKLVEDIQAAGHAVTAETLEPLDPDEQRLFLSLLAKLQ